MIVSATSFLRPDYNVRPTIGDGMSSFNIARYTAGDSITINVAVKDSTGAAVDLTGATLKWGIALQLPNALGAAIVTKTIGSGITVTDAAAGEATITLAAGDVTDAGDYYHELEVVLASGASYTALYGKIKAIEALYAD